MGNFKEKVKTTMAGDYEKIKRGTPEKVFEESGS